MEDRQGEILIEEFLKPLGLRQVEAARRLDVSLNRLNEIVLGKRGITADTALRLRRLPHRQWRQDGIATRAWHEHERGPAERARP